MSQGTVIIQAQNRLQEKDFTVATPEEFVRRFEGTRVINRVNIKRWKYISRSEINFDEFFNPYTKKKKGTDRKREGIDSRAIT